jgi:hypothetical protein
LVLTQNHLTERDISRLWSSQTFDREALATEDGQPLEIISPGWLNDDCGPDFRQAVITLGRVTTRGDIEIHVRSSSWREHGHHLDAGYNRVVLHVVEQHDAGTDIRLQNGITVPTLVLNKKRRIPQIRKKTGLLSRPEFPCQTGARRPRLERVLERSGEARFRVKAERFRKELERDTAGQSLYEGIMEALGYSRNKTPFLELARRLPLDTLLRAAADTPEADLPYVWQTLFFENSGLVSSLPESFAPISRDDWHLLKVRPNNSPLTRLTAMSHLLLRYKQEGLAEGLVNLVRETPSGSGVHEKLEEGFIIRIPGYPGSLTLLGRQRASEIVINVLLPFTFALSIINSDIELSGKVLDIYRGYPSSVENSVERFMVRRLGISGRQVNSAIRKQGLIHIYKNLCSQKKCDSCELAGNNTLLVQIKCEDCKSGQLESGEHV